MMTTVSVSFTTFFAIFLSLIVLAQASPVKLVTKATFDVWVPRIIYPDTTTVWVIGQTAAVVWDTSNAPETISNAASVVLHGYGTIAQGFDLRVGNVSLIVPHVTPGQFIITLFGDSGNFSPAFAIVN